MSANTKDADVKRGVTEILADPRAIAERKRILNADRQRRYKERHAKHQKQISTWVSTHTDDALQMLCVHHGCARRAMLEALISNAFVKLTSRMKPDEYDQLETETLCGLRTRKHRVLVSKTADHDTDVTR